MVPEGPVHVLFDGVVRMGIRLFTVKCMPSLTRDRKLKTDLHFPMSLFLAW